MTIVYAPVDSRHAIQLFTQKPFKVLKSTSCRFLYHQWTENLP